MAHQTRFRSPQKGYSRVAEKQTLLAIEHELDRELAGGFAPDEEQQLARLPTDSIARMMLEPAALPTKPTAAESPQVAMTGATPSQTAEPEGGRMIATRGAVTHVVRGMNAAPPTSAAPPKLSAVDRLLAMIRRSR